jgi:predicted extracellular nuclease
MRRIRVVAALALVCLATVILPGPSTRAISPDVVVSQVYGGGGNSGATYTHDFVELFNRGTTPVSLSGWSVQYASATGTGTFGANPVVLLSGTLAPGQYYLVQLGQGSGGTTPLPAPDAAGTINMSATAGKVVLANVDTGLACNGGSAPCSAAQLAQIVDLVGFGTANFFEGSPAPAPSNTTSVQRVGNGCVETDNNAADFTAGAPVPRNTASAFSACAGPTNPTAAGAANPTSLLSGATTLLSVAVTPGTNPTSTGLTVSADLSAIGGASTQPFYDDATHGDASAGDNVFSFSATAIATPGARTLPVSVTDAQARSTSTTIALAILEPSGLADVVISQVYGGGGNAGSEYRNDFIELYNQGSTPTSLGGWSVQYASASGSSWQVTPLSGTIPAHGYYLVREAAGSGGTRDLPAPDASGGIAMAATAGKVALASGATALSGVCPLADAVDFVGYGTTASCFEGAGRAPAPGNATAILRAGDGAIDTDNNATDFSVGAPIPRNITGLPPGGTGLASPSSVLSGSMSLLTVAVTPGGFPPSTGLAVAVDLTAIGGVAGQAMFDDGTHGDITAGDLTFSYDTVVNGSPGTRNLPATISDSQGRATEVTIRLAIEPPFTPIAAIQGSGNRSPFEGELVATRGIVTALRNNGYYIQTRTTEVDGDTSTSDGIFVFTNTPRPAAPVVGDDVRVTGTVQEFSPPSDSGSPPLTELSGGPTAVVLSSGNALPAPTPLDSSMTTTDGGFEQLERFEGMRVVADITAVSPTSAFSRNIFEESNGISVSNGDFYAVLRGTARPLREPGIEPAQTLPAGAPAGIPRFDGNPERLRVDSNGQTGSTTIEIVAGQNVEQIIGVLDYSFRTYTLLPDPGAWLPTPPIEASAISGTGENEFTVASFNIERFFDGEDAPNDDVVMTPAGLERRLAKASLNIRHVLRMPDVLGVIEVENLGVLQAIAARVNADAGAAGQPVPDYVAYLEEGNDPGGIDVGFLVKSARVDVERVAQIGKDDTYVRVDNGQIDLLHDRPPLVLEARVRGPIGAPYPITVIVNHLRSLNGNDDPTPSGDRVRQKRRLQAEFLASYIQGRQAADPTERVISVGDYNAFQFNDGYVDLIGTILGTPTPDTEVLAPSGDLVNPDLTNAGDGLGPQRYSFLFDGNAQAIDHVLLSAAAAKRFSRMAYARGNTDFPESLRADATRPERLSDHDAAVVYFAFPGAPVVTLNGPAEMTVEAYTSFTDPGATAFDDDLGPLPVTISGNVDVNTPATYVLSYSATNGFLTATVTRRCTWWTASRRTSRTSQ